MAGHNDKFESKIEYYQYKGRTYIRASHKAVLNDLIGRLCLWFDKHGPDSERTRMMIERPKFLRDVRRSGISVDDLHKMALQKWENREK